MKVTLLLITLGLVLNSVQSAITMADLGKVLGSIVTGMALGTQTDKSKKTSDCYSDCKKAGNALSNCLDASKYTSATLNAPELYSFYSNFKILLMTC